MSKFVLGERERKRNRVVCAPRREANWRCNGDGEEQPDVRGLDCHLRPWVWAQESWQADQLRYHYPGPHPGLCIGSP